MGAEHAYRWTNERLLSFFSNPAPVALGNLDKDQLESRLKFARRWQRKVEKMLDYEKAAGRLGSFINQNKERLEQSLEQVALHISAYEKEIKKLKKTAECKYASQPVFMLGNIYSGTSRITDQVFHENLKKHTQKLSKEYVMRPVLEKAIEGAEKFIFKYEKLYSDKLMGLKILVSNAWERLFELDENVSLKGKKVPQNMYKRLSAEEKSAKLAKRQEIKKKQTQNQKNANLAERLRTAAGALEFSSLMKCANKWLDEKIKELSK